MERWDDADYFLLKSKPPEGCTLSHLCDDVEDGLLAIPVIGGGMLSKFAAFKCRLKKRSTLSRKETEQEVV